MYWLSKDCRHFIVPPGGNEYMKFQKYAEFLALGDPNDDWIEFDVSRLPLPSCCEIKLCSNNN